MKTQHIAAALRNAATPAARLALWQARPIRRRLEAIRKHAAPGYPCRPCNAPERMTLADWRAALIHDPAFCGLPSAHECRLWIGENSPEVMEFWEGREFLNHRGWYTAGEDMPDWTLETCAVRLERFPHVVFYATRDNSGEGLCVHLDEWEPIDYDRAGDEYDAHAARTDTARVVIRRNDSTTERAAEEAREEFERDQREQRAEQIREELQDARDRARRLIRELRELCHMAGQYPAAAAAVRATLRGMLNTRRQLLNELTA